MWEQQLKNHSILIENQKNENTARFQKLFFSHDTVPLIHDKNVIAGHCSFKANLKGEKCGGGALTIITFPIVFPHGKLVH